MNLPSLRLKAREWLLRYVPAEIVATVTALLGAFIAHNISGSLATAAITGTICENIGYYGYFGIREVTTHYKNNRQHAPLRRIVLTALKTARDMATEFGLAECLDSLLFRPLFMYIGPHLVPSFTLGIFLGKIAADVIFYTFAIIGYEFRKRWS
jgi:hypothetical protein